MTPSNIIIKEAMNAAKEGIQNPKFEEMQLQEEIEDSKLDFLLVSNEVKQATQEAISIRTINQYQRYQLQFLSFNENLRTQANHIISNLWEKFRSFV